MPISNEETIAELSRAFREIYSGHIASLLYRPSIFTPTGDVAATPAESFFGLDTSIDLWKTQESLQMETVEMGLP